jgi:hypothetical protein
MFYITITWMMLLWTSHAPLQLPFPYAVMPYAVSSCDVLLPHLVQAQAYDKDCTHHDDAAADHNHYLHCPERGYSH